MKNSTWIFVAAVTLMLLAARPAPAVTNITWTGTTDTDWATSTNWSGNTLPVSTNGLIFGLSGTSGSVLTNTLTSSAFNIAGITFNAGGDSFTFNGNTFNLTAGITNNSGVLQTFNNTGGLSQSAAATYTVTAAGGITITNGLSLKTAGTTAYTTTVNGAGGTLTLGSLTLSSAATAAVRQTFAGSGNINITGAIADGNAFSNGLAYTGTGTLTLGGNNTYTGLTVLSNGTTNLNGTISGSVTINNAAAILNESSGGTLTGTGGFAISAGTAVLAGSNSYSGTTLVNGGTLNLSGNVGSSAITVSSGTLNLTSSNATSGGVRLTGGLLNIGNAGALGSGVFSSTNGTIDNTSGLAMTISGLSGQTYGTTNGATITFIGSSALDLGSSAVTLVSGSTTFNVLSATNALTEDGDITGAFNLGKSGVGTLILNGVNNINALSVTGGTLDITNATRLAATSSISSGAILDISGPNGVLTNGSVTVGAGGELLLDDSGSGNESFERVAGGVSLSSQSLLLYEGSSDPGVGYTQSIGQSITLSSGSSNIKIVANSATSNASLQAASFTRTANTGIALVNGVDLGVGAANTGSTQMLLLTAPAMVGGTTSTGTINSAAQNTKIVAYLLGESGTASGLNGTATGTANTFLTYDGTNGLRPLNPTDEFTNNSIVAGNNTYITAATTSSVTGTINSLVINGGDLTINDGTTLSNASGALLFVSSNTIKSSGTTGALNFGATEGIISADAGVNANISAVLTGTAGATIYGPGIVTLSGSNTISGNVTASSGAILAVGNNSALGTATYLMSGGGVLESDNQARTISNFINANGTGFIGGTNDITFNRSGAGAPAVALNGNSPFRVTNTGTTTIAGTFSLNNTATAGSANASATFQLGNNANLVINGAITDNNSGNVPSGTGSKVNPNFTGAGANITFNGSNNFGLGAGNMIIGSNGGVSGSSFYNTITITGVGTITPFGNLTWAIGSPGGGDGSGSPYLVAGNSGLTLANNIAANASNNSSQAFGFAGVNSLTISGTYTGGASNSGNTLQNISTNGAVLTFSGTINSPNILAGFGNYAFGSTSIANGGGVLSKSGRGTLTMAGTNNMTGGNAFSGGTVVLDYSTNNTTKLATGALTLQGVNLQLSGGSFAQTVTSTTTLAGGQSSISQISGSSTLALGTIGRAQNNGSALNFVLGSGAAFVTTASAGTNGILGGYATVNGTDWATNVSGTGTIGAYTGYTTLPTTGTSNSVNYLYTGSSDLTTAGSESVFSLKMDASGTLNLTGAFTIGSTATGGGLLFTGTSNTTIAGGTLQAAGGGGVSSGNNADLILQDYGTGILTISSTIGGNGNALTKAGTGTVILTGNNTYLGGTFIDQGVLSISSDGNLGASGNIVINGGTLEVTNSITNSRNVSMGANGGTIQVDPGNVLTLNGVYTGSLFKTGSGTLVINNSGNNPADITISAGTLFVGNVTALGVAANTPVSNGASGAINRSASPIFVSGGNLDIGGLNLILPNITLNGGGIVDSIGSGTLAATSFTLENGIVSASLVDMVIAGSISNNSPIYKTSDGTLSGGTVILTGNNTYSGATIISGGTLQIGNNGTTGTLGTGNVNTGETLGTSGTLAFDRSDTYTVTNAISGAGSVSQIGSGTTILAGVNSYAGATNISGGGTLRDGTGQLPAGTVLNLGLSTDGAVTNTFDLNNNNQTVAAINSTSNGGGTNSSVITNNATGTATSTLTLSGVNSDSIAANSNFGGTIKDGATAKTALALTGGTHTFSGASTYTGGTAISNATLVVNNTTGSATGAGTFLLNSTGTLAGTGSVNSTTNTINGAVQVGFSGASTSTTGSLTITSSGTTTFAGASMNLSFNLSATAPGTGTELNVGSSAVAFGLAGTGMTLTLNLIGSDSAIIPGGSEYILFAGTGTNQYSGLTLDGDNHITNFNIVFTGNSLGGGTNQSYYGSQAYLMLVGSNIDVVVVPEPGTWLLMLGGLALLVIFQRARRNKNV